MPRKTNLIFFGIDSLRADHMSLYGYPRLTTPHIDAFAKTGTTFENCFSPHIPTTPGYGAMLTGLDCFGTSLVELRHKGDLADGVKTLPEILKARGYVSSGIGFGASPHFRGFDKYEGFKAWSAWDEGRAPKGEALNAVAIPELKRLAAGKEPFFLMLRHLDPHSPYLPPKPFERIFYDRDEFDPKNKSMKPVFDFKPFKDYFRCWMPPGVTDQEYVVAQYDGELAYMDACITNLFQTIRDLGLEENTLLVIDADHGETLYDHDCYFDHHGLYDATLNVPLVFRLPGRVPAGKRLKGYTTLFDVTPTILDLLNIKTDIKFDGQSLVGQMRGNPRKRRKPTNEFYITEATWMRKHGWRTPEWKLIHALEPDFHFKPEVELYNLRKDPGELVNVAKKFPAVVAKLEKRMQAHIAKREKQTGRRNPMYVNPQWHGIATVPGPFTSSQQAYDTIHIGDVNTAQRLQALQKKDKAG